MLRGLPVLFLLLMLPSCGSTPPSTRAKGFYERYQAVRELRYRTDGEAVAEIVRLLGDPHPLVVVGALESLGDIGDPSFLQHVASAFGHEAAIVREQACLTAAALNNPEGVALLKKSLEDPAVRVRRAAVKGLAAYGKEPGVLQALARAVGDKDPGVALLAHERLRALTGRDGVARTREAWEKALP